MRIWIIAGIALAAVGCEPPAPQEPAKPETTGAEGTAVEGTVPEGAEDTSAEIVEPGTEEMTPAERWARDHTLAPPEDPQLPF